MPVKQEGTGQQWHGLFIGPAQMGSAVKYLLDEKLVAWDPDWHDDAYVILIDKHVSAIAGETPRARYYGLLTYMQYINQCPDMESIQACIINFPLKLCCL